MKIPTTKYLSKYVKHLFGIDVTFKIVNIIGGCSCDFVGGAYKITHSDGRVENLIEITRDSFLLRIPQWIIWHEVGHVLDTKGKGVIEQEYNAQFFAMEQANKRGYYKVLQLMVEYLQDWEFRPELRYRKVRKMILGIK